MHRTIVATVATVVALGLSGCAEDDPAPQFADSASASPTPAPTTPAPSTSSPPPTPDPEPLGPEETVRAWVEAQNLAMSDGNVEPVFALSAPGCRSCADLVEPVAEVHANGGQFITEGWRIIRSRVVTDDGSAAVVSAGLQIRGGQTIPRAGAKAVEYPTERSIIEVELTKVNEGWLVSRFGFLQ